VLFPKSIASSNVSDVIAAVLITVDQLWSPVSAVPTKRICPESPGFNVPIVYVNDPEPACCVRPANAPVVTNHAGNDSVIVTHVATTEPQFPYVII